MIKYFQRVFNLPDDMFFIWWGIVVSGILLLMFLFFGFRHGFDLNSIFFFVSFAVVFYTTIRLLLVRVKRKYDDS